MVLGPRTGQCHYPFRGPSATAVGVCSARKPGVLPIGTPSLIARIFRVRVPAPLHAEFEEAFLSVSVPYVERAKGIVSVRVGRPTRFEPEQYFMLSVWRDENALRDFAGEEWSKAVIPSGMERFVKESWVHHYELFGSAESPAGA